MMDERFNLDAALADRFRRDLDALIARGARVGIAVSGGPDSMALLLLAAAVRPGLVEAATVDHALRPGSRDEAELVAATCERLEIPHRILTAEWKHRPATAIQERARAERYRLLAVWARDRDLSALVTAHHLDDQAETFVMRLARGAGVRGLAGMRPVATIPGSQLPLLRPLLSWRHAELEAICAAAELSPISDPSNEDQGFERVRVRRALSGTEWLDPAALAASASYLAEADCALQWTAEQEWRRAVDAKESEILYRPDSAPPEIRRRIVIRALALLGTEGQAEEVRGRALDRLLAALENGDRSTLRGVLCTGGETWHFVPAPYRTRPVTKLH